MKDAELFPYVYVNADGTIRELHSNERSYLLSEFRPGDGAMPYIKSSYSQLNSWRELTGYLERSKVSHGAQIQDAPKEDPNRPLSKAERIEWLRKKGLEIAERSDGSLVVLKPNR